MVIDGVGPLGSHFPRSYDSHDFVDRSLRVMTKSMTGTTLVLDEFCVRLSLSSRNHDFILLTNFVGLTGICLLWPVNCPSVWQGAWFSFPSAHLPSDPILILLVGRSWSPSLKFAALLMSDCFLRPILVSGGQDYTFHKGTTRDSCVFRSGSTILLITFLISNFLSILFYIYMYWNYFDKMLGSDFAKTVQQYDRTTIFLKWVRISHF